MISGIMEQEANDQLFTSVLYYSDITYMYQLKIC